MRRSWLQNRSYAFCFVSFCLIVNNFVSHAQGYGGQIIPLSPNAAEFNRYSSVPVNGMTGIPEINFPIYEIKTGKLSVPISLSYHAGGVKVKQKATWVGLGWSLNAGGLISRAIRGKADEDYNNGWYNDPASWNELEQLRNQNASGNPQVAADAYNTMANQWVLNPGHDTHPDFFSFVAGDKSGKFIYSRSQQKFITLPFEPVKINYDVNMNTYSITDDEGTTYHYEAKETTMYYLNYPVGEQEKVQSWYLTRIVSADGTETIQFNYELTGAMANPPEVIESFSRTYKKRDTDMHPQISQINRSESLVYNSIQTLKEIIFPHGKVTFFANTTRLDHTSKALDSIVVYSKIDGAYQRINKHSFAYDYFNNGGTQAPDYRLRLLSFQKDGLKGESPLKHTFTYSAEPLPRTDAYSVDYWGFHNGAGTTGYLSNALPPQTNLQQYGSVGTAYREPNPEKMEAGMLQRITYPTGGYMQFVFEPNKYRTTNPAKTTYTLHSFKLFGTGMTQQATYVQNFQVPANAATALMSYTLTFSPFVQGGEGIPQQVILKDLTAGTNVKTWEHTGNPLVTQTYSESYLFDPGHQYQFFAMVQNHTSTYIDIQTKYEVIEESAWTKIAAGHRVSSITMYEVDGTVKNQQVYKYGEAENGIGQLITPENQMYNNYYTKRYLETTSTSQSICCPFEFGDLTVFVGTNSYPAFSFMGANILYDKIAIYQMSGTTPNGKTVQEYKIPTDLSMVYNPVVPGAYELLDYSTFGLQLVKETTYEYNGAANTFTPIEEKEINYKKYNTQTETAVQTWEQMAYMINSGCNQDKINCFAATISRDLAYTVYSIQSGCYRIDSVTTKSTDKQGNMMMATKKYEYNNPAHLYVTNITAANSNKELIKTTTYYPGDHTSSDPNNTILNKMVALNILKMPYWEGEYRNNNLRKYKLTTYSNQWNANLNMVRPAKIESFVNKSTAVLEAYTAIKKYDINGNPLLLNASAGPGKAYIWDYLGLYPIAEAANATDDQIAFTSFEYEGLGGWSLKSGALIKTDVNGVTGNKILEGGVVKSVPTGDYTIGVWSTGALVINGQTITQPAIRTLGTWNYYEINLTNTSTVDISASKLDEVRLLPKGALMTAYTYEPLIGMKSQSDLNGRIVYYEYDGLGRLVVVRDQDKNVIRKMEYKNHLQ